MRKGGSLPLVVQIPCYRFDEPVAKFGLKLAGIDRVAMIMTRAVRYVGNILEMRRPPIRAQLIEHDADALHHVAIQL